MHDIRAQRLRCDTVDPFADLMDSAIELVTDLPVVKRFGILATEPLVPLKHFAVSVRQTRQIRAIQCAQGRGNALVAWVLAPLRSSRQPRALAPDFRRGPGRLMFPHELCAASVSTRRTAGLAFTDSHTRRQRLEGLATYHARPLHVLRSFASAFAKPTHQRGAFGRLCHLPKHQLALTLYQPRIADQWWLVQTRLVQLVDLRPAAVATFCPGRAVVWVLARLQSPGGSGRSRYLMQTE
jgi:hypothetical protein